MNAFIWLPCMPRKCLLLAAGYPQCPNMFSYTSIAYSHCPIMFQANLIALKCLPLATLTIPKYFVMGYSPCSNFLLLCPRSPLLASLIDQESLSITLLCGKGRWAPGRCPTHRPGLQGIPANRLTKVISPWPGHMIDWSTSDT